jgi:hypothetical protein
MRYGTIGLLILGSVAAGTTAMAQTTTTEPGSGAVPSVTAPASRSAMPSTTTSGSTVPRAASSVADAATLEAGSNSFTEGQAKSRFEDAGFTGIQSLTKDSEGFWHARGTRNGSVTDIAMDFQGRIATGPATVALGSSRSRVGVPASPMTPTGAAPSRDGTPGNPPGTAAGRALDRATGTQPATPPTR